MTDMEVHTLAADAQRRRVITSAVPLYSLLTLLQEREPAFFAHLRAAAITIQSMWRGVKVSAEPILPPALEGRGLRSSFSRVDFSSQPQAFVQAPGCVRNYITISCLP